MVSFLSCQSQNENQEEKDNLKNQRMVEFQEYKKMAGIHSDYLQYVFEHMNSENLKVYHVTRSAGCNVSDEFCSDLCEITTSFIKEQVYDIPYAGYTAESLGKIIVAPYFAELTRSEAELPSTYQLKKVNDFLAKVEKLPEGMDVETFKTSVEDILCDDSFFIESSDEEFFALAIAAAVSIDSYEYWSENYLNWAGDLFEDTPGVDPQSFWGNVWKEVKRLANKDAEAAIQGGLGSAILVGTVAPEALLVSAGVGSVWAAFEPYF